MSTVRSLLDSAQLVMRHARLAALPAIHRTSPSGKHLALLAWALPPNTNAGVHRPLSLLRYAADAGWRVSAFHGSAPANQRQHGDELVRALPPQVKLHELADSTLQPVWRWTPQIDGGFTHALAFAEQALEQLRADPPSLILASGPPFMVFVAARWLARKLGVPYVLDYRDEWSECPFDFVSHGRDDRNWERRCIADAQAVIFTTESHRLHQLQQFPELQAARTQLIPNGWEAGDFDATATQAAAAPRERFTLAHVGNLAGHTSPRSFLSSVERLVDKAPHWRQSLRLQFIGRRSPEAERALREFRYGDMLDLVDHVSKREAAQRMQGSDALLLLANEDLARYLPSKLFDYVASRRPVLVYGHAGEASALAGKLSAGLLCEESADLGEALAALQALRPDPDQISLWLDAHRRDVLSKRFFALFDTLPSQP